MLNFFKQIKSSVTGRRFTNLALAAFIATGNISCAAFNSCKSNEKWVHRLVWQELDDPLRLSSEGVCVSEAVLANIEHERECRQMRASELKDWYCRPEKPPSP